MAGKTVMPGMIEAHLHLDLQDVEVVLTTHDDLIVGAVAAVEKNGFNLTREYVYTSDNEHIVCSAHRLCHLDKSSSAGAFFA